MVGMSVSGSTFCEVGRMPGKEVVATVCGTGVCEEVVRV